MDRKTLAEQFTSHDGSRWKTFVVEAHPEAGTSHEFLSDVFAEGRVAETEDVYLNSVTLDDDLRLVIDSLDERFWSFHSTDDATRVSRAIRGKVSERRDLDFIWLSSYHLRQFSQRSNASAMKTIFNTGAAFRDKDVQQVSMTIRGKRVDPFLNYLLSGDGSYDHTISLDRLTGTVEDPDYGLVREMVGRKGQFLAQGDSFELHQRVVADFVEQYRSMIDAIESNCLVFSSLDTESEGGFCLEGSPIELRFSQPIPDLSSLFAEIFAAREPFRLWGLPEISSDFGECEAVDLHSGACLLFEAQPDWMRIHLPTGACGNSIMRLAANLQYHVDGNIHFVNRDLDELHAGTRS